MLTINLKLQDMAAESLSRYHRMGRNTVATLFNMLENVAKENNLPDKPGNVLNVDEIVTRINKKPASVITEGGSKGVRVLTSREKCKTITVIARCNAAIQFLPSLLICKGVNKKQEFGDGLYPGSYMYMNRKSTCISTDYSVSRSKSISSNTRTKLQRKLLNGNGGIRSFPLLLQTAVENNATVIPLPSHYMPLHTFDHLDKRFLGLLKSNLKNKTAACEVTQYLMGRLIGFAWGKSCLTGCRYKCF
jgi:hypothetical protein